MALFLYCIDELDYEFHSSLYLKNSHRHSYWVSARSCYKLLLHFGRFEPRSYKVVLTKKKEKRVCAKVLVNSSGGGVLPYTGYTGISRCSGYGLWL